MSQQPIYGVSQSSPFAPGVVGLGVSNLPIPVQLLRVTPTLRRVASRVPVNVGIFAQVQNLLGIPVWVRAAVTATAGVAVMTGSSQTVRLAGNAVVELPAAVFLGPLGNWTVAVQLFYSFDGIGYAANPDTGSTDVNVFLGDIVGQEYACSQTVCTVNHAQIDYRDNPSFANFPH